MKSIEVPALTGILTEFNRLHPLLLEGVSGIRNGFQFFSFPVPLPREGFKVKIFRPKTFCAVDDLIEEVGYLDLPAVSFILKNKLFNKKYCSVFFVKSHSASLGVTMSVVWDPEKGGYFVGVEEIHSGVSCISPFMLVCGIRGK
ncbi:MAG: hypothetical protein WCO84_05015 [bacterium]